MSRSQTSILFIAWGLGGVCASLFNTSLPHRHGPWKSTNHMDRRFFLSPPHVHVWLIRISANEGNPPGCRATSSTWRSFSRRSCQLQGKRGIFNWWWWVKFLQRVISLGRPPNVFRWVCRSRTNGWDAKVLLKEPMTRHSNFNVLIKLLLKKKKMGTYIGRASIQKNN